MSAVTPRGHELCCSASRSNGAPKTPTNSPICYMRCWWLRSPPTWASNLTSSTPRPRTDSTLRPAGPQRAASDDAALEAAALPLGQAAPDAEALVIGQRVLQAPV